MNLSFRLPPILLAAALSAAPALSSVTTTIPVSKDTFIKEITPDCNHGPLQYLQIANTDAILLGFDLSSISSQCSVPVSIESATLKLILYPGYPDITNKDFNIHKITSSWEEGTGNGLGNFACPATDGATWFEANAATSTAWTNPGGDFGTSVLHQPSTNVFEANVTDIIQESLPPNSNYGLGISVPPNPGVAFRSREYNGGSAAPSLQVTYACPSAQVSGDPHFTTWHGEHFDYHGQCSMVLVEDEDFLGGKRLAIHIRTKIYDTWSYIESAVVKIGDDKLQVNGGTDDNIYWINDVYQGDLPSMFAGLPLSYKKANSKSRSFMIDLGKGHKIEVRTYKEFVRVNFIEPSKELYGNTVGLLGDFATGARLARDGKTVIEDLNEFGQEWQVMGSSAMLFNTAEGPQAPLEKCILPSKNVATHRHLRKHGHRHRHRHGRSLGEEQEEVVTELQASVACDKAGVQESERADCIADILAVGDLDMAGAY